MRVIVQEQPFDLAAEVESFAKGRTDLGAVVTFHGIVRGDDTGTLDHMMIEHYPGMTERALEAIRERAGERWTLDGLSILHRVGQMEPGDLIVTVIACSRHRQNAFDACAFAMDYLKTEAPFWKLEDDGQGDAKWVDARESDHTARARWGEGSA